MTDKKNAPITQPAPPSAAVLAVPVRRRTGRGTGRQRPPSRQTPSDVRMYEPPGKRFLSRRLSSVAFESMGARAPCAHPSLPLPSRRCLAKAPSAERLVRAPQAGVPMIDPRARLWSRLVSAAVSRWTSCCGAATSRTVHRMLCFRAEFAKPTADAQQSMGCCTLVTGSAVVCCARPGEPGARCCLRGAMPRQGPQHPAVEAGRSDGRLLQNGEILRP